MKKTSIFIIACTLVLATPLLRAQEPSELAARIDNVIHRITQGEMPRITEDFLLAGLTLDPKFERRFTNFSGDQEGRYLSALTPVDPALQSIDIHHLVAGIVANQKADGRFGADSLSFDAGKVDAPQMALLWGNGRLLTGLVDYYTQYPEHKEALQSAVRLGDFLSGITAACTRPEVIDRFKTMGALGFICFTQITEGMTKLYTATGNEKYRKVAETTYPLLPEPGNQHSHGYLNTLRGVVMLYEATKNPVHLQYAEKKFRELLQTDNYLISGGVPEFFNFSASADGIRDEGCSEADFLMLCIQLWNATGNMEYLDKGEYLLMNQMFFNQFRNGDFGHHVIQQGFGFVTAPIPGQSWWCCNYHSLQALDKARNIIVTRKGDIRRINLFFPSDYKDELVDFSIQKIKAREPAFEIAVKNYIGSSARIGIRKPSWSKSVHIMINGKDFAGKESDGYIMLPENLKTGDRILFACTPVLRFLDEKRNVIPMETLTAKPVQAAIQYGPWLLSVDEVYQNLFMTEVSERNVLYLPAVNTFGVADPSLVPEKSFNPEAYLACEFLKDGTSQTGTVILRPMSEASFQGPSNVRFWLLVARKP
jgi:DUF1680 family protein